MRASMAVDAVARELWPKESRSVKCLGSGGVKGSWVVALSKARWRGKVLGLESKAALL